MRTALRTAGEFLLLFAGLLAYIVVGLAREAVGWLRRTGRGPG